MNDSYFVKYFSQFHKRYKLLSARETVFEVAFFLTTIPASILTIDRIVAILTKSEPKIATCSGILIMLGVVSGITILAGIIALAKKSAGAILAKDIDKKINGEELLLTAVDGSSSGRQSVFSDALFKQASDALKKLSPQILILTNRGYRWGILLALAIFLILFLLPTGILSGMDFTIGGTNVNPVIIPGAVSGQSHNGSGSGGVRNSTNGNNVPNQGQHGGSNFQKKSGIGNKPGQIFGPESQKRKVKLLPEGVNPLIGKGKFVEKEKMAATGEDDPNSAKSSYSAIFSQYKKVWEDAIHREGVPKPMREFVKSYFDEIKPK